MTWIGFGALGLSWAAPNITWRVLLYAGLSLTIVRMVPVAIAMARRGARLQTIAFMGWFGPRGLASLVFGLLALERGVPEANTLLTTVAVTVFLSVFLHGFTSVPFVAMYHRWYEAHAERTPAGAGGGARRRCRAAGIRRRRATWGGRWRKRAERRATDEAALARDSRGR